MTRKLIAIGAFIALFAVTGCSDSGLTTTTVAGSDLTTTTAPSQDMDDDMSEDMAEAAAAVQTELTELEAQIQSSAAAEELQEAWTTLQVEISSAIADITANGTVDAAAIQVALDNFQSEVEALGDQVEPELTEAWNTFRQQVEQLIS